MRNLLLHFDVVFALWLFCAAIPAQAQSAAASLNDIVGRMQAAELKVRASGSAHMVTREYQLSVPGSSQPKSQVIADIRYTPPSTRNYTIRNTEGSDRGAAIVRKVLDHESEMAGQVERVAISEKNYDFALAGEGEVEGRSCYILQLKPKRENSDLLVGKAWVDRQNFLVRKIEGQPSRNPSWWIKNLHLSIEYGDAEGVWTQLKMRADAEVRFAGEHVLTSKEIDVQMPNEYARNQPATSHRSTARRASAADGAWIAR